METQENHFQFLTFLTWMFPSLSPSLLLSLKINLKKNCVNGEPRAAEKGHKPSFVNKCRPHEICGLLPDFTSLVVMSFALAAHMPN